MVSVPQRMGADDGVQRMEAHDGFAKDGKPSANDGVLVMESGHQMMGSR